MARDAKTKDHGGPALTASSRKNNRNGQSLLGSAPSSPATASPQAKKRKRENKSDESEQIQGYHEGTEKNTESPRSSKKIDHFETQTATKSVVSASDRKGRKNRVSGSEKSPKSKDISKASGTASVSDESATDLKTKDSDTKKSKKRKNILVEEDDAGINAASEEDPPVKVRKHKHEQPTALLQGEDAKHAKKHAKILKKFEKSTKVKKLVTADAEEENKTNHEGEIGMAVVAQGLEPLPQPEPTEETGEKPTYSTMPNWITNPVTQSPYQKDAEEPLKFDILNLDGSLVSKLKKHGYSEATPVQATVIPLLIDGKHRHKGDLCVSASTGSGKTLSYVLPIGQSVPRESFPRLRGLIVVPTRELVKQVREAFEACGSNLRIGTAIGHVALKDEQQKIMRWDSVYNPSEYDQKQKKTMSEGDWATFDLIKYRDEVERAGEVLPQYVQVPRPNIDVLISTPGRLVDHIRQTEGFTLRHLEWLVVDEADRLLNESFQEWVSVLMGALDKQKTANVGDSVMASIGCPLQSPYPKKVILSATLTNDITKLNSLRLENPKLVAIGSRDLGPSDEELHHGTEQFVLPSSLVEHFVPVGDGSEKPIHLMKLLLLEINKTPWTQFATPAYASVFGSKASRNIAADDDTSSESDYTSSSGDDTSSSDSTSDSDSNSDSDSDSTSDSASDSDSDATSESSSDSEADTSSDSESETSDKEDSLLDDKPLTTEDGVTSVLIFTKSTESAARLSHLLGLMNPALKHRIGTIVKSSNSSSSRKTLKDYRAGKISIIVATDRASRGIDLVGLGAVINYDMPTSLTTYVHRVGRTARAGKSGHAWTLVEHREGLWFQKVVVKSDNVIRSGKVMKHSKSEQNTKAMIREYTTALEQLEKAVKG